MFPIFIVTSYNRLFGRKRKKGYKRIGGDHHERAVIGFKKEIV
ncbi:hypothetical protein CHCC20335_4737 [Bacillus paralicheniformis]|nr:hypothetical protein CHCC20335_4737 [Bacillus paralicheniformis]